MTEIQVPAAMREATSLASTAAPHPPSTTVHTAPCPPYDDHSSPSSLASHHSTFPPPKSTTNDVVRSSLPAPVPKDLTPPSSAASPSQEHEPELGQAKTDAGLGANGTVESSSQSARGSRSPSASGSQSEGTAGTKRTASGQIKRSHHVEPQLDSTNPDTRHVRAASSLSAASTSNVTEISQQLRTRLQYAMVKVQHGWQSRSLDELESLASASPRSHASPFQAPGPFSPRRHPITRKWSDSSSSEGSQPEPRPNAFPVSPYSHHLPPKINGRSLAPPADIQPNNSNNTRRRRTPNEPFANTSTGGATAAAWHALSPHTHSHPSRPTSQRTPSQNAAMEADAVETLMFLASPNNSGYHPSSQTSQESNLRSTLTSNNNWEAQTSPLRSQFSQTSVTSPKKVAFEETSAIRRGGPGGGNLAETKSQAIDRMIDAVPLDSDSGSDRDLDEALRLAAQTKVAAA